ncbi:MAG TPA: hypothetical protein VFR01_06135, partial [Geobacterales bacterium]|nr:hypothetical protein [Geobacterales bacterium]
MSDTPPISKNAIAIITGVEVNLTPLGFHQYAEHFLHTARVAPVFPGFSPVQYYLYCHSLELVLKAYLLARGVAMSELRSRSHGHNLLATLMHANQLGLASMATLTSEEHLAFSQANAYYHQKGFEYFNIDHVVRSMKNQLDLPALPILDALVERLTV